MDYDVYTPFSRDGFSYKPSLSVRVHASNSLNALRFAFRRFGICSSSIKRVDSVDGVSLYLVDGIHYTVSPVRV